MVFAILEDEESMVKKDAVNRESTVSKYNAPCPFLVLDALRDRKPHESERFWKELATVVVTSISAEVNLYRTINQLASYDPPLICEGELGSMNYLVITETGNEELRGMETLMSPDFKEYFIQKFEAFFKTLDFWSSFEVVHDGTRHITIHTLDVDRFSPELGNTMLGYPRYMISLAEEALARLGICDEPVTVHFTYTSSPFLYFEDVAPQRKEFVDGGSIVEYEQ